MNQHVNCLTGANSLVGRQVHNGAKKKVAEEHIGKVLGKSGKAS